MRLRSIRPYIKPRKYNQPIATSIGKIIGTKTSFGSTCNAVAARAVGPPHGVKFMIPLASIIRQAIIKGLIPIRLYSGSIAATQIMYVVEPSPSRETIKVSVMVPRVTFKGSPLTCFKIHFTEGSNRPVSIIIAK